ncbi:DUF1015 family protein, partial [Candidatus Dependentiae bacterium]|nr:DUF1015 family protein [Candidatus Dependentiae bacterium]
FITQGFFEKEKKPCFYIYRKIQKNITNTGIIGKIAIENYLNGEIKKHEKIITQKAKFAEEIIKIQNAFIEPILLTYDKNRLIKNIINKTTQNYPDFIINSKHKTKHLIWKISDKKNIKLINKELAQIPSLYIADGHHRSAAAANLYQNGIKYMTAALFSSKEITIYPYHRMLKNINNLPKKEFFKILKKRFHIIKNGKKTIPKKNIRMYFNTKWYTLKSKDNKKNKSILNKIKNLFKKDNVNQLRKNISTYIFEKKILFKIFGKGKSKRNESLDYISGKLNVDKLISKFEKENYKVLFLMPAINPSEFLKIADCDKNLPPKATWIEPKIKAGIIVKDLEE